MSLIKDMYLNFNPNMCIITSTDSDKEAACLVRSVGRAHDSYTHHYGGNRVVVGSIPTLGVSLLLKAIREATSPEILRSH